MRVLLKNLLCVAVLVAMVSGSRVKHFASSESSDSELEEFDVTNDIGDLEEQYPRSNPVPIKDHSSRPGWLMSGTNIYTNSARTSPTHSEKIARSARLHELSRGQPTTGVSPIEKEEMSNAFSFCENPKYAGVLDERILGRRYFDLTPMGKIIIAFLELSENDAKLAICASFNMFVKNIDNVQAHPVTGDKVGTFLEIAKVRRSMALVNLVTNLRPHDLETPAPSGFAALSHLKGAAKKEATERKSIEAELMQLQAREQARIESARAKALAAEEERRAFEEKKNDYFANEDSEQFYTTPKRKGQSGGNGRRGNGRRRRR